MFLHECLLVPLLLQAVTAQKRLVLVISLVVTAHYYEQTGREQGNHRACSAPARMAVNKIDHHHSVYTYLIHHHNIVIHL